MTNNDLYRWKQKIDPAFDKPINEYVAFLGELERSPTEGRFNFPDDFIEPIIKNLGEGGEGLYSGNFSELTAELFGFIEKASLEEDAGFGNFLSTFNSLETTQEVIAFCLELVDSLPEEESRQFYIKKLEAFSAIPDLKPFDLTDPDSKDFFSIISSLLIRYLFIKIESMAVEDEDRAMEHFRSSKAIVVLIELVLILRSQIAHQKTLDELLESIGNGDDKALFKAIKVDKSLLYTDAVKKRILTAQLSGDADFFNQLGKAIADNPLKRIGEHGKTYAVLRFFWYAGLYKLTNEELHSFLESCGLIPPSYPYAFEKFLQRHIKSTSEI